MLLAKHQFSQDRKKKVIAKDSVYSKRLLRVRFIHVDSLSGNIADICLCSPLGCRDNL